MHFALYRQSTEGLW